MKKMLFSMIVGVASLGMAAVPSQAGTFGLFVCDGLHRCGGCGGCGITVATSVAARSASATTTPSAPPSAATCALTAAIPSAAAAVRAAAPAVSPAATRLLPRRPRRHDPAPLRRLLDDRWPGRLQRAGDHPAHSGPTANPGPGALGLPYGGPLQAAGAYGRARCCRQTPVCSPPTAGKEPFQIHKASEPRPRGSGVRRLNLAPLPLGRGSDPFRSAFALALQLLDDLGDEPRVVLGDEGGRCAAAARRASASRRRRIPKHARDFLPLLR